MIMRMKSLQTIGQPRLWVVLSLVFALVPLVFAVLTYRDAQRKDARVYDTTAQVLAEQLQHSFERHTYFPIECRKRALGLADAALHTGAMVPGFDWQKVLPGLTALGYAKWADGKLIVMWATPAHAGDATAAVDLASQAGVMEALRKGGSLSASSTRGCLVGEGEMLVLLAVPATRQEQPPRGFVLGWINLNALCNDPSLPLIRSQILSAQPLSAAAILPADARRTTVSDGTAEWGLAVQRGARFSEQYGTPPPWLMFSAVGLSAIPLLILALLAGRSAQLGAALRAEQEIVRQQRYFTQSVSHEFRTPLGIIMSGADLLADYLDHLTPERRREVLTEIKANTRLMSDMVEQVLALGRIESGLLPFKPKPVQLALLCHEIARKAGAGTGDAIVVQAVEQEAPLDAALISSVLTNLLSNAIKYSPPGKRITLTATADSAHITFTVRDEGIGIPVAELSRV